MTLLDLQLSGPIWMLLALPFLFLVAPRLIRLFVSLFLNYRRKSEKQALQAQIVEYRKELSKISQVDEFAKYSKVQRKLRATTDQLNSITRQDLELNVKYVLVAQALAWLIAVIFCFRLTYQLYAITMEYLGFYHERESM